ncbi:MAG: hypothetical protein GY760_12055 [Deltaproteobacteria bacterium]|nr:hypothetical protein [Deltaproteobacteria bacterium]
MKIKLFEMILSCLLVLMITTVNAQTVPSLINYQGMLTDSAGKPLTGNKKIEFNLYDSVTSTISVWGPQVFKNVSVVNGRFNVILGEKDIIGRSLIGAFGSGKRFIAIKVNEKEILPRQQILSTPFAVQSENAKNAENSINSQNADLAKAVVIPTNPSTPTKGYRLKWNTDGTASWELSWYETEWFDVSRNTKHEKTNLFGFTKIDFEIWWNSTDSDENMRHVTGQFYHSASGMGAYKRINSNNLIIGIGDWTFYSEKSKDPASSRVGFYKLVVKKH